MVDVLKYRFTNGYTAMREYTNVFVRGNTISTEGRWVLRDAEGNFVEVDRYRNDLFERHDLIIENEEREVN